MRKLLPVTFLILLVGMQARAQPESSKKELLEVWKWKYNPDVGMKKNTLSLYKIYIDDDGNYSATFEGGVVKKELRWMKKVTYQNDELRIDHNRTNMYFIGKVQHDKKTIVGTIYHHSNSDQLILYKVDPMTFERI